MTLITPIVTTKTKGTGLIQPLIGWPEIKSLAPGLSGMVPGGSSIDEREGHAIEHMSFQPNHTMFRSRRLS